jgi:ABC-type branched-subunit amino acid transport system ATPase component/branched-subunit amino acid ABC-type transport system permease component
MSSVLPFIVAGLVSGSIYSLAGVGLVLTYKTSGVFNFAHGSLASVAAFIFYVLYEEHGVAWPLAALIAIGGAGLVLGLVLERVARSVEGAPLAIKVASTVGLLLVIQAAILLLFSTTQAREVSHFLPQATIQVDGVPVTVEDGVIVAVALLATVALALYFRFGRSGLAMQAVVDDPVLLDIAGTSPTRTRRAAWIIGAVFAAASGVLLAPLYPLDATTLTLLVVQAFGAAAFGAFSRLPATYLGGLAIGVGTALCSKYFTTGALAGLSASLPFLVLFAALLVFPRRWVTAAAGQHAFRSHAPRRAPRRAQILGGASVLVLLVLVPGFAGVHLDDWTQFLGDTIVLLSLGLLVRNSGQVSLCQVSFMAIGVTAFSQLTESGHIPWLIALVLSGLIAMPVGAVLATPAIRLSGIYLALATFSFGVLLQYMFYSENFMFGATGAGVVVPRPSLPGLSFGGDSAYYYLVLAITLALIGAVILVQRTRLGRLLTGLRDSPVTLGVSGASVYVTQVVVFCLAAFLAAVAGALSGAGEQVVTGDSYLPFTSLLLFAVAIVSVGGEPWYALIGAAGLTLIPSYFTSPTVSSYLELFFGLAALLYGAGARRRRAAQAAAGGARPAGSAQADGAGLADAPRQTSGSRTQGEAGPTGAPGLVVADVRVRFGGLTAVDGVSIEARPGLITGLIGPNGAGKTTLFNACSGLCAPSGGKIAYAGAGLDRKGVAARARLGLGRTFQQMRLFESLEVYGNVALGVEAGLAGGNPLRHIVPRRHDPGHIAAATTAALEVCGLGPLATVPVQDLSTGQRRLVELARCVAGSFGMLLLDEPSSGLDRAETAAFGAALRQVVAERGVGVLLIEHDMDLVYDVCDYVYVLDFGRRIYAGIPAEIQESATVRAAYLGGS